MFFKDYKFVGFTNVDYSFLDLEENEVQIPYGNHPGAFGFKRKHHFHEGIDLYCKENDIVLSLTSGIVVDIGLFTGERVNSPWWNETQYIAVQYKEYVIVYGELIVNKNISVNDVIDENTELGYIVPVLKNAKNNRPTNMLHLELYDKNYYNESKEWITEKPIGLLNPIILFI